MKRKKTFAAEELMSVEMSYYPDVFGVEWLPRDEKQAECRAKAADLEEAWPLSPKDWNITPKDWNIT